MSGNPKDIGARGEQGHRGSWDPSAVRSLLRHRALGDGMGHALGPCGAGVRQVIGSPWVRGDRCGSCTRFVYDREPRPRGRRGRCYKM